MIKESEEKFEDIEVGFQLPAARYRFTREGVVRYASVTKDFNPIHWDMTAAREFGLKGTNSPGMLIFAQVLRTVTAWARNPAAVIDYEFSFQNPLLVPDDGHGTEVEVLATVSDKLPGGRVRLKATATCNSQHLIRGANVVVQL
ncbi:acyl dehydratase [Streptomyces sp. V4I23]|uniref:MaoC/PaaZ C-terminal domain-containing protein n=1 Tax=Streptomyces sp. V4I23 TaxID=3042282 RepID=UPI00277EB080|nr:MaoC/PaaZ C-terminal domain-containing protein [Streptomyces sp. V4I23]MDQ1005911.1 acyl dehydratase [Streptomyces sp. V4I23]